MNKKEKIEKIKARLKNKSPEELRDLYAKIEELKKRRNENLCKKYIPNKKCEQFIKNVGNNEVFINLFTAANGVGKSCLGANMVANICFGPQNKYFENMPIYEDFPYIKKGRIISDPTTIREMIIPELKKWFPSNRDMIRWETKKEGKNYEAKFRTSTGFEIDMMTTEQSAKEFESVTLGWCLDENTRVLMGDGIHKKIKNIRVGDTVVSYGKEETQIRMPRSQYKRKVTAVYNNGEKDCFKITTSKGYAVTATAEHRFYTSKDGWKELKDISTEDKLCIKEHDIKGAPKEKWKMALLGALIGDGCLSGKNVHFTCFSGRYLEEIKSILPSNLYLTALARNQFYISSKTPRRNELKEYLKDVGLWGHKSGTKFIPEEVFTANNESVKIFLSHLYATDGWFSGKSVGYGTTSRQLAEDLQLLLRRFDIAASFIKKKSQKPGKWNDQYWVVINRSRDVLSFCENVQVDSKSEQQYKVKIEAERRCFTKGKKCSLNTIKSRRLVAIKKIEPVGKRHVYDISVEKSHNFLANGILTHNCWIDEPCPKDIYLATVARLRAGGILFWTLTPLSYSAWIKDDLYDKRDGVFIEYVSASVWDNCKDIEGTRGVLTRDNIDKMISQYPLDERESRIEGKFGHLLGRVHKWFDERIHVVKPFKIDPEKYVVAKAHDTHPRVPDHINWIAIDDKGRKFICNELQVTGTTADMASQIKAIEKNEGYRMVDHLIDPSAFNEDKRAVNLPVSQQFWDEGIDYRRGSKDLDGCIRRTDDALYFEEKEGQLIVEPELFIFNTCRGTINQINSYVWDEHKGRSADQKQPKPKPKDKDDHYVENVHRLVMENYQFEPIKDKFAKKKKTFARKGFNRAY